MITILNYSGALPTQILAGFLGNDNFEGTIESNPFVFAHNDICQFTFLKNGEPQADYRVDFDKNVYLQAYQVIILSNAILLRYYTEK